MIVSEEIGPKEAEFIDAIHPKRFDAGRHVVA